MDSKYKYFCGECDREFHSPVLECLWCGSPDIRDISLKEISSLGDTDEELNADGEVDQYEYFCSECEAEVAESSNFCHSCGTYIGADDLVSDDEAGQTTAHLPENAYKEAFRSWADRELSLGRIFSAVAGFCITFFVAVILLSSLIPPGESTETVVTALSLVPAVLVAATTWSRN